LFLEIANVNHEEKRIAPISTYTAVKVPMAALENNTALLTGGVTPDWALDAVVRRIARYGRASTLSFELVRCLFADGSEKGEHP
jgi:hypothetical protein